MNDLTAVQKKFILHWGEMGTRWGINRTVAQVHALLFVSSQALTADDITEALSVARSNVSNSLKELQQWGIIKVAHVMGDRRDHFEALKDVWEVFKLILAERKRREIDPTIAVLRDCVDGLKKGGDSDGHLKAQLADMLEFFEAGTACFNDVNKLSPAMMKKAAKISGKVTSLLGLSG
jgi:DNA-binding transcriptional regulator GbsR (MarR family)